MTRSPKHPAAGGPDELPGDLASAQEAILALRALLTEKDAALIAAQSEAKVRALEIERLKLQLAKARHEVYGQSSERAKLLVEQLELAIEDLEEAQAEEETRAEMAAPASTKAPRKRTPRGPRKLPDNLPVERIVEPVPCACGKCGGLSRCGQLDPCCVQPKAIEDQRGCHAHHEDHHREHGHQCATPRGCFEL